MGHALCVSEAQRVEVVQYGYVDVLDKRFLGEHAEHKREHQQLEGHPTEESVGSIAVTTQRCEDRLEGLDQTGSPGLVLGSCLGKQTSVLCTVILYFHV